MGHLVGVDCEKKNPLRTPPFLCIIIVGARSDTIITFKKTAFKTPEQPPIQTRLEASLSGPLRLSLCRWKRHNTPQSWKLWGRVRSNRVECISWKLPKKPWKWVEMRVFGVKSRKINRFTGWQGFKAAIIQKFRNPALEAPDNFSTHLSGRRVRLIPHDQ